MKKLCVVLAIFALIFATCDQPIDNNTPKLPNLTIRNESSFVLTNVTFSGISFATSGNDLPVSSRSIKQLTADDVNKTGYITFTRKDIGITCRTEAISIGNEDYTFTFLDTSVVEEIANTGNKKSLSQITFVSKVTVQRGGLTVAKNDTENLGEAVINIGKSTEFTLKNISGRKLLLTGTEPVKITGTGAGSFSVVQPSSSEIAPNSSLTFKINFTPATAQNYNATVTIYSNDQDGNFTFKITATGVPPKPIASVFYEENEILQNETINAGEVFLSQSKNIIVVIRNTGAGVLTLETENISITGTNANAFIKLTNPGGNISAGNQSSFLIECTPIKQGESYATLTIPTNDNSRTLVVVFLRITAVIPTTVSYDINGGSGITPAAQMINAGSIITLPDGSGFSKNGYTFGGWNTNTSGTGTNYNAGSSFTPAGNITLYAKWDVTCTVTFNANGATSGTAPSAQTTGSGSNITLPSGSSLSKTDYTFSGWNTNTSGTGNNYSAGSSYTVTGNITLYAKWEDASTVWTVKFETNGGSPIGDAVVLKNTTVSRPSPDSTKTGYTLDGWYTNTGLTALYNFSSIVTGNITLYAKWSAITYTVAYNANGGTGTTANSSHTYDVDRNLTSNGFTRIGHTFAGWARTTTGAVEFTNGQSVRNLTTTAGSTVTLYAKWNPITYTVTYNINSGSGTTPSAQPAAYGSSISLPSGSGLSRTSYTFGGWNTNTSGTGTNYNAGSSYTVTGNVTLYAKWDPITVVPGATLAAKLSWLHTNALSNVDYTVEITANENIGPTDLSYSGRTNIGITLKGIGAVRTVSLSSNGYMFMVYSGVTLVLDNNITLQGRSNNNDAIVVVNASGRLVMNTGSLVTGNTSSLGGGGVYVEHSGTFTMNGGTVSGNTVSVSVSNMLDRYARGGGVFVDGTFTMSGGTISGNTASGNSGIGGGVFVNGTFTMSGGIISGNTTSAGTGSGQVSYGGGVCVSGTFTMSGGTISGNTVSFPSSTFRGSARGGGVHVDGGTFTKTSGTIYGYSASDIANSNVVKNSSGAVQSNLGHAVYAYFSSSIFKRRETTAGTNVNLMFNGDNGTFSGSWDN